MSRTFKSRALLGVAAAALAPAAFLLTAVPANAQDGTQDEIYVTGSRIKRTELEAATATTVVDSAIIDLSGAVNAADLLRQLPAFGVSGLTGTNSNFLVSNSGINTLELRNLGEDRTLVLVNGRRFVGGVPGSAQVDFNQIPTELIERIEVITGGASAVYGSDALAGVVNVILKDDFEGVAASFQGGSSWDGGNTQTRANLTLGGNFADDRGNAVVNISYSNNEGLLSRQRPNTQVDDIALCLFTGDLADCETPVEPFFSSFSESGRFFPTGANGGPGSLTFINGATTNFSTGTHGFNRQAFRTISVPTQRFLFNAGAHYDVNDYVRVVFEGSYANSTTSSRLEPFPLSSSDLFADDPTRGIPFNNPFVQNTPGFAAAVIAGNGGVAPAEIPFTRRLTEIDNRGADADRDTFRFVIGLEGTIAEKWDWQVSYNRGRTTSSQISTGQVNVANFREALNATVDGSGNIVCANPIAAAEGCVPINLIGIGSISPEAANYVRADSTRVSDNFQQIFQGTVTGPLFELPAGALSVALGAEYREESSADIPDALSQSGGNGGNVSPITAGSYDVYELFGEVDVPLLANKPFFKELSIGGAYRYSDYSLSGTTHAYSGNARWAPADGIAFRFQYARAVRAPNIGELFQPEAETFATVSDPCNGVTAATTGVVADNCRLIPQIAARIAATGSFTLSQPEIQGTGGFISGNPNLGVEKADTYQAGILLNPDFGMGEFLFTADYFNISIDGTIAAPGRQFVLDSCFNSVNLSSSFCGPEFTVRQSQGPVALQGALLEVNTPLVNAGTQDTSGIDFFASWAVDLADLGIGQIMGHDAGAIAIRGNYTRLLKNESVILGEFTENKGTLGAPVNEFQTSFLYQNGPVNFLWETTHFGKTVNDADPSSFFFGLPHRAGTYHDVQIRYSMFDDTASIVFGVDNVFDRAPATILSGVPGNTTGLDTSGAVYDPIGRRYYAGVRVQF